MKFFWKYIFPVLFGIAIYTSVRLVNDTTTGDKFWERSWQIIAIELITVIVVSFITDILLKYLVKKYASQKRVFSLKNIGREFGFILLVCLAMLNATIVPMAALTDDGLQLNDFVIINIVPTLYTMLYYAIARGNSYVKAYAEQQVQIEKIKNDQLETELKFLKAQYHPHFLFNALNTIYFQMDEDVPQAKKTVEKFSELLRYQLYNQQEKVPVSSELQYLRHYIELQRMRSSDKLQLQVDFDEHLNGESIYPMLFLPLVENAFKYVGGEYKMHITALKQNDCIAFTVVNDTPQEITYTKEKGIGLENLRRRLELLYPGKYIFTAEKNGRHFTAHLELKTGKA